MVRGQPVHILHDSKDSHIVCQHKTGTTLSLWSMLSTHIPIRGEFHAALPVPSIQFCLEA
jgi:hypothetical protein